MDVAERLDGDELLARPGIELITVDSATLKKAEQQIESCEHCHAGDAEIPFDWIVADVMAKHGPYSSFLANQHIARLANVP